MWLAVASGKPQSLFPWGYYYVSSTKYQNSVAMTLTVLLSKYQIYVPMWLTVSSGKH